MPGSIKAIRLFIMLSVVPLYSAQLADLQRASNRAQLFAAAETGMVDRLRAVLPQVGVNAVDTQGRSALMIAMNAGKTNVVDFLLQQPEIDIYIQDQYGMTALEIAVHRGLTAIVEKLLNMGADIQPLITRHVLSELQEVVTKGIAAFLGQEQDPLTIVNKTLLFNAYVKILQMFQRYEKKMRNVIGQGIQAAYTYEAPSRIGEQSQLVTDIVQGFLAVPDENKKAKFFEAARTANVTLLQNMLDVGLDPNQRDEKGNTPLMLVLKTTKNSAAMEGKKTHAYYDAAKLLLSYGADVNAKNNEGTPLILFAMQSSTPEEMMADLQDPVKNKIISILFGKNGVHGRDLTSWEYEKFTERSEAYEPFIERMRIVKLLLDNKVNLNEHFSGLTPLAHAVNFFDWHLFKALLSQSAIDESTLGTAIITGQPAFLRDIMQHFDQKNINSEDKNQLRLWARQYQKQNSIDFFKQLDISLFDAIKRNDLEGASDALSRGAFPDTADSLGVNPLMQAAQAGNSNAIQLLLDYGANINAQDNAGLTALQHAAMRNKFTAVKLLLSAGADPEVRAQDGRNFYEVVNMLSSKSPIRALAYATQQCGIFAQAAYTGDSRTVENLLSQNKKLAVCTYKNFIPLSLAVKANRNEIAELLLANGANPNRDDLLAYAVKQENPTLVDLLLKAGADPLLVDAEGMTPQARADRMNNQGIKKLFESYDEFRADIFDAIADEDEKRVVELLLSGPAYVNLHDADYNTPLRLALNYQLFNVAQLLLEKGAHINENYNGELMTPLMQVAHNNPRAVDFLLDHGADYHKKDKNGYTALMYAVRANQPEIAKVLIARGSPLSLRDNNGHDILADIRSPALVKIITDARLAQETKVKQETERRQAAMLMELKRKLDEEEVKQGAERSQPETSESKRRKIS